MSIEEGNKLIAEFMGLMANPYDNGRTYGIGVVIATDGNYYADEWVSSKYHSSWDWIMQVVDKIEAIKDKYHGYFGVHIVSNSCTIQATKFRPDKPAEPPHFFFDIQGNDKKHATWQAVVHFIQWYTGNTNTN